MTLVARVHVTSEVVNRAVQDLLLEASAVEVYGVLGPDWRWVSEVVIGCNCSYKTIGSIIV